MSESEQRYTGGNHILGGNIHMAVSNEPFLLVDGKRSWLTEWHCYFGPSVLNKKTRDPVKNQPGEGNRFWLVVQWWKDQGAKVVDGVGQWKEPERIAKRYAKFKRGLIEDEFGEIAMDFWKGYEYHGPIRMEKS